MAERERAQALLAPLSRAADDYEDAVVQLRAGNEVGTARNAAQGGQSLLNATEQLASEGATHCRVGAA